MSTNDLPFDAVIRVSRRNGREGDSFMSPDEQRDAIQRRADADGVTIARWFYETDSVSGGTVDREDLQTAIARAKAGKSAGIYVAKVDRFARTVQGGLGAMNQLEDCGGQLRSAREGVIVGPEKATGTDRLIRTFWLMLAQWQRDTLAEGWAAVTERHISAGIANHAPFGYCKDVTYGPDGKPNGGTRRLVPHTVEAPWVTVVYEMRANGASWRAIADHLNAEEVAPRGKAAGWGITSVRKIVGSRVYLGEIASGATVNPDAHDALISVDLWEQANSNNATTVRREVGQFMLSGLIRCASCGVRMAGRTDRKRTPKGEVEYRYYRCRRTGLGKCSAPALVRADEVDALVTERFRETFLNHTLRPSTSTTELDAAMAAQVQAETDLHTFLASPATDELRRTLGDAWADEGQRARLSRVVEAREAVAAARSAAFGVALPVNLAEDWDNLDVEDQRAFLSDGFEVVAVSPDRGPVVERVGMWRRGDPNVPRNLPGVGSDVTTLVPIRVDVPAGTGVTAA